MEEVVEYNPIKKGQYVLLEKNRPLGHERYGSHEEAFEAAFAMIEPGRKICVALITATVEEHEPFEEGKRDIRFNK